MRNSTLVLVFGLALSAAGSPHPTAADGPYSVLNHVKVGGDGGFDYVYADSVTRKLYVCRMGATGRVSVFNLDTLQSAGELSNTSGHGAATDAKYGHGFISSKPVAMYDAKSLAPIKTIEVDGRPDGLMNDPFNHRTYIFSHSAPNATVLDDKDGTILGTIDLGGAPEQAATDGKGRIYVDIEDKSSVAVVDASTMKVVSNYDLNGKGATCAGLALDARNHVLFVACRDPQTMVMLDANTGKYISSLPIGRGCDGVVFNPKTMETFASAGDGTLTIIKETSPTTFEVEQTVTTTAGAKTCTLDARTGKIYLIAAEYGPAPEAAAGDQRRPRAPMIPGSFSIWEVGKAAK